MEQISNQKKLRPWMGVLVQAAALGLFVTVGAYMQRNWGKAGLFTSELMFAVFAVAYCLVRRVKLKEMFPIKKISLRDFFGTLFMAAGMFMSSLVAAGISIAVLPDSLMKELTGLSDYLYSDYNVFFLLAAAAVMPAICEEMLERGLVQSHFRSIKKDWVIALIIGCFFGIMHMSFMRFLNTACAGFLLALVMAKKNNILLPMIMHFILNGTSVVVAGLGRTTGVSDTAIVDGVATLGSSLTIGFLAPIMIVVGLLLLDPKGHKWYRFVVAGCLSVSMLTVGIGMVASRAMSQVLANSSKALVDNTYMYTVEKDPVVDVQTFVVQEERNYEVLIEIDNVAGEYTMELKNPSGGELFNVTIPANEKGKIYYSETRKLSSGTYTMEITPGNGTEGERPQIHMRVK